jgi:hypothetical protein
MRLWTWQSKRVESIQHSSFLRELKKLDPQEAGRHEEAYRKIFQLVDTNQLIWCYKDYSEAVYGSIEGWEKQDCILWELDVPEEEIRWYCPVAWERLRTGTLKMCGCIWDIHQSLTLTIRHQKRADTFLSHFNSYWNGKTENELLDSMFLQRPLLHSSSSCSTIFKCPEAIVIHPVCSYGGRIIRNPLDPETGKWYSPNGNARWISVLNIDEVPCPSCQSHNHVSNCGATLPISSRN